ncbi:hypothetical protein C4E15_24415 [Achromobacter spanius]|uniref:Uncharacterized protein n=1 Tax=Achromobacter spanius TaxID=217203 RepID=A0A2S5GLL4_9BURK|nr:hypothetical protein C4E15_24415 [Achromobacter spanius]
MCVGGGALSRFGGRILRALPRCRVAALPRCRVAALPRCRVAALPRCLRLSFSASLPLLLFPASIPSFRFALLAAAAGAALFCGPCGLSFLRRRSLPRPFFLVFLIAFPHLRTPHFRYIFQA